MRKTVEVTELLRMANHFLANSEDDKQSERFATANFIESVLHYAGAYAGFDYLASAGIKHDEWGQAWDRHRAIAEICQANNIPGYANGAPRWEDYCADDSRRHYITHIGLKP